MKNANANKRKRLGAPPPPPPPKMEHTPETAAPPPQKKTNGYPFYCPTCGMEQNLEKDFLISLSSIFDNGHTNDDLIFLLMNSDIEIDEDYFSRVNTDPVFDKLTNHYKYLAQNNQSSVPQNIEFANGIDQPLIFDSAEPFSADPLGDMPTQFEDETAFPVGDTPPQPADAATAETTYEPNKIFVTDDTEDFNFSQEVFGSDSSDPENTESDNSLPFDTMGDNILGDANDLFPTGPADNDPLNNGSTAINNDPLFTQNNLNEEFEKVIYDLNQNSKQRNYFNAHGIFFDMEDPEKLKNCEKFVWIESFLKAFSELSFEIDLDGVAVYNPIIARLISTGLVPFENGKFNVNISFDFKTLFTEQNINAIYKRIREIRLDSENALERTMKIVDMMGSVKRCVIRFDSSLLTLNQYLEPNLNSVFPQYPGSAIFSDKKVSRRICSNCCSGIPYYSGLIKQSIISFIGMPASGKSTIIDAVYSKLKDTASIYTNILYTKISEEDHDMARYNIRRREAEEDLLTNRKTDLNQNPSLSVMVAKRKGDNEFEDGILFTFVDIPGEVFMAQRAVAEAGSENNFRYFKRFKIMSKSDLLNIVIASEQLYADNDARNTENAAAMALNDFDDFYDACDFFRLRYLNENSRPVPVSFILSKIDAIEPESNQNDLNHQADGAPNYKRENYYIHKDAMGHTSYIWKTHTSSLQRNRNNMKNFMEITKVAAMFDALKADPKFNLWTQPNPALDLESDDPKNGYINAGRLISMQKTAHEISNYVCAEYEDSIRSLFQLFDPGRIDYSDLPIFPISPFGFYGARNYWEVDGQTKRKGLESRFNQLSNKQLEMLIDICRNENSFKTALESNIADKNTASALRLMVNCEKNNPTMNKEKIFDTQRQNVIRISNRFLLAYAAKLLKGDKVHYEFTDSQISDLDRALSESWEVMLEDAETIDTFSSFASKITETLNNAVNNAPLILLRPDQVLKTTSTITYNANTGVSLYDQLISEGIVTELETAQQLSLIAFFKLFFMDYMKKTDYIDDDFYKMAVLMAEHCIADDIPQLEKMYDSAKIYTDEQLDLIRRFDEFKINEENVVSAIGDAYKGLNMNKTPYGLDYLIFWIMILSGRLDYLCLDTYRESELKEFIIANREEKRRNCFRRPNFTTANCAQIEAIANKIDKISKDERTAIEERNACRTLQRKLFYFNRPYKQLKYFINYSKAEKQRLEEERRKIIEQNPCF